MYGSLENYQEPIQNYIKAMAYQKIEEIRDSLKDMMKTKAGSGNDEWKSILQNLGKNDRTLREEDFNPIMEELEPDYRMPSEQGGNSGKKEEGIYNKEDYGKTEAGPLKGLKDDI